MKEHALTIEVWTKNAAELKRLRRAVQTFNGAISAQMACIEREEARAGDVWVTIAVANTQQAFALGRCYGTLRKGGPANG